MLETGVHRAVSSYPLRVWWCASHQLTTTKKKHKKTEKALTKNESVVQRKREREGGREREREEAEGVCVGGGGVWRGASKGNVSA